jgi:hypothetical protein
MFRAAAELADQLDPVPLAAATYLSNIGTILLAAGDLNAALEHPARAGD